MAARAPGPRWEQGACCCRRGREQSGRRAGGHSSQRAAAHHRLTRGPRRGGGGPAARAGDAAGRLRARGLGPRLLGGRGGSSGGWSSAPRTGSPMAAAPRKTCEGKRSKLVRLNPPPSCRLRLSTTHPPVCLAPQLTWSRGRDQERPGIAARRSVLLLFVPRFLTRCLTLGVLVPQGVPRHSEAKPWAVSGKRAPCDWGRETFTRPGALLGAPLSPGRTDSSFLPGSDAHWGRLRGRGLNETQLRAKRLRLSRSWPPRPDSTHLSGGSGWGAPRPCSSGGFFHYVEDALAGIVGPRRSSVSDWPGRILYTELSAKKRGPQLSLALPDPGTSRFRPTRYPGRGNSHSCRCRRRRPRRAKGKMQLSDAPTPSAFNKPRPASARHRPGGSRLVRAAVCRCGSSPSLRCPPPRVLRPPPLSSAAPL